jgi:hypothetical protein
MGHLERLLGISRYGDDRPCRGWRERQERLSGTPTTWCGRLVLKNLKHGAGSPLANVWLCRGNDDAKEHREVLNLPMEGALKPSECENACNHEPIRMLRIPLINQSNRLASMGSRFAQKITPPMFHLIKQTQWVGCL